MKVRHYILTNFNLPRSFGGKPKSVPDEAWLAARFEIFEQFCLPSVRAQRDQRFRWLIRFDPTTPERYLSRVRRLGANVEVVFEPFRQRIARDVARGADFLIMSRLDNDDALHVDFTRYVRSRMDGETKLVDVKGYQLDVRDGRRVLYVGKYIETHRNPTPFISLMAPAAGGGFPMVDAHPHHNMGKYFPVDDSARMYFLQIIHGQNASNKIVGRPLADRVDLSRFGLHGSSARVLPPKRRMNPGSS